MCGNVKKQSSLEELTFWEPKLTGFTKPCLSALASAPSHSIEIMASQAEEFGSKGEAEPDWRQDLSLVITPVFHESSTEISHPSPVHRIHNMQSANKFVIAEADDQTMETE
ncbi:unnamed protein product [Protopolystoma xenopodis]|uniref:Uncharacterized protein n=1 Tax=Protopolystoma xenopodis TaxID=117903 RepID=A0A3S5FG20_9PLAT|nr:unnamed protein product [Protopolystoma xenopodis]